MFYELIYTRCRQGMDILRKGQSILSEGYKVYACTPDIMEDGVVDLPLLAIAALTKQSYHDPSFMEEAYLYYVPDKGASFLLNFHPIPFDINAKGDYSHRPGNYVNHVIVGDFSGFYPFEMFRDKEIWVAKTRSETYYYENTPSVLPPRNIVCNPARQYSYEEIGAFIGDGRKEALATAVSFLIAQYEVKPENRKFLVIRDDSSEKIELWIAAIEYAFSPRMASAVPFATRMDKFVNANRYTVNQLGAYQAQLNLQDPNHRQRYRAMIVGVDERDKLNVNVARPLANSPFVLLNGIEKCAMFEGNTTDPYYKLITSFDDYHKQFCREFLQSFDIPAPSADIFMFHDAFIMFNKQSLPNCRVLAGELERLSKYKVSNTSKLREIYNRIDRDMPRFLQEDLSSALSIMNWLKTSSKIIGDSNAERRLSEIVCKVFIELVFRKGDSAATRSFWALIKRSEFARDVAKVLTDIKLIQENTSNLQGFHPSDAITLVVIYLESATLLGKIDQQNVKKVVGFGLDICYRNRDKTSVKEIVMTLSQNKDYNTQDILFSVVKSGESGFAEFIIGYMIDTDDSIVASDETMWLFCKRLYDGGLENLVGFILQRRIKSLYKTSELEKFMKTVREISYIGNKDLKIVFESIDKQVDVFGKNVSSIAELLQLNKPDDAMCKNSAHLYALDILSNKRRNLNLVNSFNALVYQGFPTIQNQDYIDTFIELLLKVQLSNEEQVYMIQMLNQAPKDYLYTFIYNLCVTAAKQREKWNILMNFATETGDKKTYDMLVRVLADSKQNEKSIGELKAFLNAKPAREYFMMAANNTRETIPSQKNQSRLDKVFEFFKRG